MSRQEITLRPKSYFTAYPSFVLAQYTTGILWDGKIDVIKMKDTDVLDIDSEEDFVLMQFIARYLYEQYPAFAQVRDHIREV